MTNNKFTILHPTDFSETARNAFIYARELALKKNALLLVMHSSKLPYNYGLKRMMDDLIIKNRSENLNIETIIELGNTVSGILGISADLIVMGSKGKSNLQAILFGSVSSEVMLESDIPVLVIPPDREYSDFRHITFATDYRDGDLEALEHIINFAELFNSKITIVHIATETDLKSEIKFKGFKDLVSEKVDCSGIEFRLLTEQNFAIGIASFLKEKETDLLVMTRYQKTFFQSFMQSNHLKQAGYTEVPILVLPKEETLPKGSRLTQQAEKQT